MKKLRNNKDDLTNLKTRILLVTFCLISIILFTGCHQDNKNPLAIPEAYINGFEKFYEKGQEYEELGLQIQAEHVYSWAGVSVSSMRYCIDCLLYMKGEGNTLEEVTNGRLADWNSIASMNYASPYPYYFEGLMYNAQGKNEYATLCYENALINPAFTASNDEALVLLEVMTIDQLKSLKEKLITLEDKIYKVYTPTKPSIPRDKLNYSDAYLRTLAKVQIVEEDLNYTEALKYYKVALSVNPYEGDNFMGCALMYLYMDDLDSVYFYVNEGLYVDPNHTGLLEFAAVLNREVGDQ